MPEMNGIEVLKKLRTVDSSARVIILTGFGTQDEERRARELGATAFLHKEFSLHAWEKRSSGSYQAVKKIHQRRSLSHALRGQAAQNAFRQGRRSTGD